MIQFDESEHLNTALEEDAMRILLSFLPREAYDQLLYGGEKLVPVSGEKLGEVIYWEKSS